MNILSIYSNNPLIPKVILYNRFLSMKDRIITLDGFRALLAILVMWHHFGFITLKYQADHSFFNWFFWFIGEQGGIAVYFFFVLAGFLMAKLYPTVLDTQTFYLKRIARIFPIYWSACLIYTVQEIFHPRFEILLLILMSFLIFSKYLWRWIVADNEKGVKFLKIFLSFSFLWGISLLLIPSSKFLAFKELGGSNLFALITFITNSTLTFGFTDSVPVVNAVFWSLGMEVIFYLFYPYFSSIISNFKRNTQRLQVLLMSTMTIGIYLILTKIFQNVFNFNVFRFETSLLFSVGIFYGLLQNKIVYPRIQNLINHNLIKLLMLISLIWVAYQDILQLVFGKGIFTVWNRPWLSLPAVFLVFGFILLGSGRVHVFVNKFLTSLPIRKLGDMSYSLYLFHGFALIPFIPINPSDNHLSVVAKFVGYTLISIFFAWLVYMILEKDYFETLRVSIVKNQNRRKTNHSPKIILVCFFIFIQGLIALHFRPDNIKISVPINPQIEKSIKIDKNPIEFTFVPQKKDFAIVVLRLAYEGSITNGEDLKYIKDISSVTINLLDQQKHMIASTKIPAWGFGNGRDAYRVGFPVQRDSKNKKYILALSASQSRSESIKLLPIKKLELIHIIEKRQILKNKSDLIDLLFSFFSQSQLYLYSILNIAFVYVIYKNTLNKDKID